MSAGASRLSDPERTPGGGSRYRLRDLFTPLDTLLAAASGITMRADANAAVLGAVEASLAQGRRVLLPIMDSPKLAPRAPSATCLDEIAQRWPRKFQQRNVQHVIDRIAHVLVKIDLLLDRGMAVPEKPAFEV